SDKPMSVKGAVNSTDTSFTRTGIESKDSWVSAKLGASAALTENLNVFGVVNYNQESNHSNSVNYSVGLNYSF
ncbi:MAG: autotransporter outer membrane beta-barrel domain-containing protein, partial [Morganella sp. (in: enterobacteria)]